MRATTEIDEVKSSTDTRINSSVAIHVWERMAKVDDSDDDEKDEEEEETEKRERM